MSCTPLSIGTYQIGDVPSILCAAWEKGMHYVDTAPNYKGGHAQTYIRSALDAALNNKIILNKEDIQTSSKVGFIPPNQMESLIDNKIISLQEKSQRHSISPAYLRYQIGRNLEEISTPLEILFLHNPETQLHIHTKENVMVMLKEAFIVLEELCSQKHIMAYGISTWSGFGNAQTEPAFSLKSLYQMAHKVAGNDNHFKYIQIPISLVNSHFLNLAISDNDGPLWAAQELDISVHASSPLHGGKLPKVMEANLCNIIGEGLSAAQACLLFSKSYPSVKRVLTSPSNVEQLKDSLIVSQIEDLSELKIKHILDLFTH